VRETVLLNAAAALAAAAGVPSLDGLQAALADGYARAAQAIDSGSARALLERWAQVSARLSAEVAQAGAAQAGSA
jgi:anthranilate phosphoribosyltransferase